MCFSATASFVAGTALLAAGTVTMKKTSRKAELPFAAIPLLFGLQQVIEGVIWLTFRFETPLLNVIMTHVYSFFSHVLWPIYVPFAILLLEPVPWRRKTILTFLLVGSVVGLYLLAILIRFPVTSEAIGGHIAYLSPHFYVMTVMASYLIATCVSMFFSSHNAVFAFGVVAFWSAVAAYAFYTVWFISVWCFFAAVLSGIVYLYFRNNQRRRIPGDPLSISHFLYRRKPL